MSQVISQRTSLLSSIREAVDTWSLSPDGKKLTSDYVVHLPKNAGDSHVRRVFDKKN